MTIKGLFYSLFALAGAWPAFAVGSHTLSGQVPVAVAHLQPLGAMDASRRLDLAIALPLRNRQALTNLLAQLYNPASPEFHQYLTPGEFAERFGPTRQDYQKLIAFAQKRHLGITGFHSNRTLLDVNGTVAEIESAFRLHLKIYRHPKEARTFFAPDAEPSLDSDVPVLAISGLDDFVRPQPMDLRIAGWDQSSDALAYSTGSGPRSSFLGNDFRNAYVPGMAQTGSGQFVGLFELDGYFPNDITAYEHLAGLPAVPLQNVLLNGYSGTPGANNVEVALDIDMALSMAPGLSGVVVYQGRVPNDVLNRMATDNRARQLSCSWGFRIDAATEQIFLQYAAQGQSFFQASGDLGAWSGNIFPPSDDANLTVVGGTSLTTTEPGGAWASENAWQLSGGGVSTSNAIPAWQQGLDMTANQGSTRMRNVPDVACHADVNIWLVANNGQQGTVGGTSAAAPLWAGFLALANQQAATRSLPSLGFLNPALYALGRGPGYSQAFHDIVNGSNTNAFSPTKFFAVPGYDLCTGWGTPNGSNLVNALLAPLAPLRISPDFGLVAGGPAGGPFTPANLNFVLTNAGNAPLNWTLVNTSLWLEATPTSGTLLPGGPAQTVSLTPTSVSSNLSLGSYSAAVLFSDSTTAIRQTRSVGLAVVAPPQITLQPVSQSLPSGANASFSVATAPDPLLFFRWLHNGTNLTDSPTVLGSTTDSLTVSEVSPSDAGVYSCLVSNAAGTALSAEALLTITSAPPFFFLQPSNTLVLPGAPAAFVAGIGGDRPLSLQWLHAGTNLVDGPSVSGATSNILVLRSVSPADAGSYELFASNALGFAVSPAAVLTLLAPTAPGVSLEVLHSFTGSPGAANPNGLVLTTNGLFGTATHGGSLDFGTVFQASAAGQVNELYSFSGAADGGLPFASLAPGVDGNLYGTTFEGGAFGEGTAFRITPAGSLTTLLSLTRTNGGSLPYAALLLAPDGDFYGTTYEGGDSHLGTVFRLSAAGQPAWLHSFSGGADGSLAYAPLALGSDGAFYGTTVAGGNSGDGTVFRITANGILTTLFNFNRTSGGAVPYGGLALATDGYFYGTTFNGGAGGQGTLYRMPPSGALTNLHFFTGGSDGANPRAGLLEGLDGNLYGTTVNGGNYGQGTLFRLSPDGTFATLVQFDGYNGANPEAVLVQAPDGSLFGTTQNGGSANVGVLFHVSFSGGPVITTQPATQSAYAGGTVALSVAVTGGSPLSFQWFRNGTNLVDEANLAGATSRVLFLTNVTTADAGLYSVLITNSLGSVLSDPAALGVIVSPPVITLGPTNQTLAPGATAVFAVNVSGSLPISYQWQMNGTNLADGGNVFGSTTTALTIYKATEANNGTYSVLISNSLATIQSSSAVLQVIPITLPGTRLATLHGFTGGQDGRVPNGLLAALDGTIYGTTQWGGAYRAGTVFTLSPQGEFTTLASFDVTNGESPRCRLSTGSDGQFYGTTYLGGSNYSGAIFRMATNGDLSLVYSFTGGEDGANPQNGLLLAGDGNFYGVSGPQGGAYQNGSIYRLGLDGAFTNLYSFAGTNDGSVPAGELALGADGDIYGVTTADGPSGHGTIFKLSLAGDLSTLHSFTGDTDGSQPTGGLAQGDDGSFYGTTAQSRLMGYQFYGVIFKVTTNGQFSTMYILNYTDGFFPAAGLLQARDGNFYGTTSAGGATGHGTLFRITPTGALTTLVSFDGFNDGARPASALVQGPDGSLYGTTTTGGPGGQGTVFRLSITAPPQVTCAPASQTVYAGAGVTFSVAAFGAPPLSYQWQLNGSNLTDNAQLSGSTNRILVLQNSTLAAAGQYSVVVTDPLGSITSQTATLTVIPTPLPVFQSVRQTNDLLQLTWSTVPRLNYQVQYRSSLKTGAWLNLGNPLTATNSTLSAFDPIISGQICFYRILVGP